jgi:hypothetical protein
MPDLTPNLGIKKPLGNENVSRASFNDNWDIIDAGAAPVSKAQMVKLTNDDGSSQIIPDGTDIRAFAGTGFYIGKSLVNMPNNDQSYFRFMINASGPTSRTFIAVSSANAIYIASINGGVWVEWEKVSTDKAPPWSSATLQNGWANFGGSEANAGYTKVGSTVRLRGIIKNGTTTAGTTLFTLPSGYRPATSQYAVTLCSGNGIVRLKVDSAGAVTLNSAPSSSAWVQLDNISFIAEQ